MIENDDKLEEINTLLLKLIEDDAVLYEKEKIKELIKIFEGFVFDFMEEAKKEVEFEEIEKIKENFKVLFKNLREIFLNDDSYNKKTFKRCALYKLCKLRDITHYLILKGNYLNIVKPREHYFYINEKKYPLDIQLEYEVVHLIYETNFEFNKVFDKFGYLVDEIIGNDDKLEEINALLVKLTKDRYIPYEKEEIKELIKIVEGFVFDFIEEVKKEVELKEVEFEGGDISLEIEKLKENFKVFFKNLRENYLNNDYDTTKTFKKDLYINILYYAINYLIFKGNYLNISEHNVDLLIYKTSNVFNEVFKVLKLNHLIKKGNND
jgi:hypothetical protein